MLNTITRTVADVITAVKRQFGDESGVQLTNNDIIRWINAAQTEIVAKNGVIEARFRKSSEAHVGSYQLPTEQILHIVSIHYNGARLPSIEFAEAERRVFDADPTNTQEGTPQFWWEWGGEVSFWPTPEVGIVDGITIYAIKMPASVSLETDKLSVPDKYFNAVVRYCMMEAHEMDEEYEAAASMRQQFALALDEKNGEEERTQHSTYPTITIVE